MAEPMPADKTPRLALLREEIRGGLPMDRDRMDAARVNEDFYRGENCKHLERREGESLKDFERRPKRYSRLARKAIRELTSLLYNPGPARQPEADAAAKDWLELVWRSNHANRLMRAADRKATLNDCCAVQAVATGDDARPIRLYLWGADEFAVYLREDDPCEPWAVVTVSVKHKDGKKWREYAAWSAAEYRVYATRPIAWADEFPTAGGTAADYRPDLSRCEGAAEGENPYGALPFAFVWNERPVDRFWGSGIGDMLVEANAEIDRELSDVAEHVSEFLNPRGFARNVPVGTRILEKVGRFAILPQSPTMKGGDNAAQPDVFYLQAQLGVEAAWWDAQKFANQTFHELDVPLSAVRDDQQGPTSGLQIIAEQAPLVRYTEARQSQFAEYEEDLAKLILRVSGGYYPGKQAFVKAADDLRLSVTWTAPRPAARDPQMDESEKNDFVMGLTSRVGILMGRGMTREQALAWLEQVAEDHEAEAKLFPEPIATPGAPPMAPPDPNADPNDDENADPSQAKQDPKSDE